MESDKIELNQWLINRNWEIKHNLTFPLIGYIVSDVAAGFLIQTDSTFCILEPFISNPLASKENRDRALDIIITKLIDKAKELNYKGIFGFSTNLPMIKRGVKHGFCVQEINSTTIFKEIK